MFNSQLSQVGDAAKSKKQARSLGMSSRQTSTLSQVKSKDKDKDYGNDKDKYKDTSKGSLGLSSIQALSDRRGASFNSNKASSLLS